MNKDTALLELEKARGQLLDMVNSKIDALKIRVENGEPINDDALSTIETLYPLSIRPMLFKGTKPAAVYFDDEKVPVKTWRKAYTLILQRCAGIPEKRDMLISLCNKISGRTRVILSDKPDRMDFPIKITDKVFIEGDFDTEWLIRILTTEILDTVRYDYSGISVSVVNNKRRVDVNMKCKQCEREIVKIDTASGKMVCNADPVHYWMSGNPNTSILTPNGETIYCVLKGKLEKAHGIGYTLHTCFQEPKEA